MVFGEGRTPHPATAATNPWTNPPATAPSSNTSHHYVYQPAFSNGAEPRQQPAVPNPWTNPPAPTSSVSSSSNWSHHAVYNPSSAGSTSPAPMYYPGGSQSAQIQFHSSQLAAEPTNFKYYQGLTSQQVNDRNIYRAQNHGGFNPVQLVPQNASPDNEYFCRELDGTWTVRTVNTIMNSLNPGQWAYATTGYPYWVRHSKE
ncbi:MAG: hypothetical protein ALECFALPRED_008476 [Alectoria fallacina]|uniref:Uncharacterized protein n=1 Tax=Alectoria fallacina TaxID=1903189 RepID=A0A8H3J450_9LECA|nr:MAG: hypothetical protein ALECFALPRED_008476 [Alectoria fallacina]